MKINKLQNISSYIESTKKYKLDCSFCTWDLIALESDSKKDLLKKAKVKGWKEVVFDDTEGIACSSCLKGFNK